MSHSFNKKVLVIDDSHSARLAIKSVLVSAGFEAYDLPSAIGATRMLLRKGIGVVVIDLGMPGLSGDRLVGLLRKNPRLKDLVVILVSGTHEGELARVAEQYAIDGVLSKDLIPLRLVGLIAETLQARSAEAAAQRAAQ